VCWVPVSNSKVQIYRRFPETSGNPPSYAPVHDVNTKEGSADSDLFCFSYQKPVAKNPEVAYETDAHLLF